MNPDQSPTPAPKPPEGYEIAVPELTYEQVRLIGWFFKTKEDILAGCDWQRCDPFFWSANAVEDGYIFARPIPQPAEQAASEPRHLRTNGAESGKFGPEAQAEAYEHAAREPVMETTALPTIFGTQAFAYVLEQFPATVGHRPLSAWFGQVEAAFATLTQERDALKARLEAAEADKKTMRQIHEEASGMGLCEEFFWLNGINPGHTEVEHLRSILSKTLSDLKASEQRRAELEAENGHMRSSLKFICNNDENQLGLLLSEITEERQEEKRAIKSLTTERDAHKAQSDRLREALEDAKKHLDYCGYGDKWERECAKSEKLPQKIEAALAAMQAKS